MLQNLRSINPQYNETKDRIEFIVVQPNLLDWIFVSGLLIIAIPFAWATTRNPSYFAISIIFYLGCAYTILEDTFQVVIDKRLKQVSVQKTKLGRIHWIKSSNLEELVNIEAVCIKEGKRDCYRLEMEFMSEFGFYRLNAHESLIFGNENRQKLDTLAKKLCQKLKLKPFPTKLE